jgi:hypothetical protein
MIAWEGGSAALVVNHAIRGQVVKWELVSSIDFRFARHTEAEWLTLPSYGDKIPPHREGSHENVIRKGTVQSGQVLCEWRDPHRSVRGTRS